jgi:uncharacterized protein (TIGR00297 family)
MSANGQNQPVLQWQSHLLALLVVPTCAVVVGLYAAREWSNGVAHQLLTSLIFAFVVWAARAATAPAALAGGVLTAAILLCGYASSGAGLWYRSALAPLLALFLLTFGATRFGRGEKERLGVAEDRHGRVAAQVVANLGVAGIAGAIPLACSWNKRPGLFDTSHAALLMLRSVPLATLCSTMLISALAEATADTLSSELGQLLGGEPRLVTNGKRVPRGTDGAISLAGTLIGMAAAAVIVLIAVAVTRIPASAAAAAGAGGIAGFFFDSLLGATTERTGWLNNDAVNFLSTLAAAVIGAFVLIL